MTRWGLLVLHLTSASQQRGDLVLAGSWLMLSGQDGPRVGRGGEVQHCADVRCMVRRLPLWPPHLCFQSVGLVRVLVEHSPFSLLYRRHPCTAPGTEQRPNHVFYFHRFPFKAWHPSSLSKSSMLSVHHCSKTNSVFMFFSFLPLSSFFIYLFFCLIAHWLSPLACSFCSFGKKCIPFKGML